MSAATIVAPAGDVDALQLLAEEPDPIKARLSLCEAAAGAAGGRRSPFLYHKDFGIDFNTNCFHHVGDRLYCGLQSGELLELSLDDGSVLSRWQLTDQLICGVQYVPSTGWLHVASKTLEMLTVDPATGEVLQRTRLAEGTAAWRLLYVEPLGSLLCGLNTGEVVKLDAQSSPPRRLEEVARGTVVAGSTVQAVQHCADLGLILAAVFAGTVVALDDSSMAERWSTNLNDGFVLAMCKHAESHWLFAVTRYSNVHCIDPVGGDVLWKAACGETHPFAFNIQYVPELQRVYVAQKNGEMVSLDSRTGRVTNTLKMPTARGICVMEYVPARCVMCVGIFSGELLAVDLSACNLPLRIPLATDAVGAPVYVAAAKTLYVPADGDLCALSVQDTTGAPCLSLSQRRTLHDYVEVGIENDSMLRGLTHVAAEDDSGVLFAGTGAGEIVSIDPVSLEVTERVHVASHEENRVTNVLYVHAQKRLYVSTGSSSAAAGVGEICAYDPDSLAEAIFRLDLSVGTWLGCLAYLEEKNTVVVGTKRGEVVAVDANTGELQQRRSFASGTYVASVLYVPETHLLFVLMNGDAELLALEPENWEVVRRCKLGVGLNASTGCTLNWVAADGATGGLLHVGLGNGDIVCVDTSLAELSRARVGPYHTFSCRYIPEVGRLFLGQMTELLSEPVAFDVLGHLPSVLRKEAEACQPWTRVACDAMPASCGGGTALHAAAFLDKPELSAALLAAGTPLWTCDTRGYATALEIALERRSFRALKVLIAAAATTPRGMADCTLMDTRWATTIAKLAGLGVATVGPLGGLLSATTRELLGEVPTHASISSLNVFGADWPRLEAGDTDLTGGSKARVVPADATATKKSAAWPPQQGSDRSCLIELRCVAIPDWARCREALDAVIDCSDDSFVASAAVQALVKIKWTTYARACLVVQALLHYGMLVSVSFSPSHGVSKLLLILVAFQLLLSEVAQLVRFCSGSSSCMSALRHVLRLRSLTNYAAFAGAVVVLAEVTPAELSTARWLRSITKLVWWLRGIYFLRTVGQLSAMLRMMQAIIADVAAFMFLLLFAMIAMTSTLDELRLLTDTEAAYFPGGYQVPFATFFKVYDIAVFGSSLPQEFRADSAYEWWAIFVFFSFSFVGCELHATRLPNVRPQSAPSRLIVRLAVVADIVMMNFLIAVMGDTFERVQERGEVLALKESATLARDVDAILPQRLLARLNPRYVLFAKPAVDLSGEWTGFFGEIKREVVGVRGEVRALDSRLGEVRSQLQELHRAVVGRP